ncbi:MAG: type IV pilin protein [Sandaracinaceae bacterium]
MRTRKRASGYTLIELMIVVAIIGVLATVAIPSFQSYLMRARTTEAVTFLGEVRQRQEAYRAEFGSYCAASATPGAVIATGTWNPRALPAGNRIMFDSSLDDWDQLGAVPDGPSYFQYRTVAGAPSQDPGITGYDGSQFWFVAQAQGDLDSDGDTVIFEAYSAGSHIFVADGSMNALPAGWE